MYARNVLIKLMTECEQLAKAVSKQVEYATHRNSDLLKIENEMGDVIAAMHCAAEQLNINLEKVFSRAEYKLAKHRKVSKRVTTARG